MPLFDHDVPLATCCELIVPGAAQQYQHAPPPPPPTPDRRHHNSLFHYSLGVLMRRGVFGIFGWLGDFGKA